MKTIHAKLKSEYSYCLHNLINQSISEGDRYKNYNRMVEIEQELAKDCDKIQIIVTTERSIINFENGQHWLQLSPPMTESDIANTSH